MSFKICNVKDCNNRFESVVWWICEEHRKDYGKDGYDQYEYKSNDPGGYMRKQYEKLTGRKLEKGNLYEL